MRISIHGNNALNVEYVYSSTLFGSDLWQYIEFNVIIVPQMLWSLISSSLIVFGLSIAEQPHVIARVLSFIWIACRQTRVISVGSDTNLCSDWNVITGPTHLFIRVVVSVTNCTWFSSIALDFNEFDTVLDCPNQVQVHVFHPILT